ncbi:hypothetical protein [Desmospora activa]|uniref:Uncharacterized protein n=1 Tax=Desmospora activa DSM 45169 TaxID=1121389 RepID=A0A2T4YYW6_9BACL|nr:hypothetical protein [Desmospora activa]PTM51933.1 hypothetical protein C8J48_3757 [Desmospora activa DSM 45169]
MSIDHTMTEESIVCPHCGHTEDGAIDPESLSELGDSGEIKCDNCEKEFRFYVSQVVRYFDTEKMEEETVNDGL